MLQYVTGARYNLSYADDDDSLVQAAHQVCIWKEQGWWNDKIVDAITSPNSDAVEHVIVETAVDVYCPQYR